jgi:hypothetical protein
MKLHEVWKIAPLAAVAIVAGMGCSQGNQENLRGESVEFAVLEQGTHSGIQTKRFETIKDNSAFRSLWLAHTTGTSPAPPMPELDFSKEMVIAAFVGMKNTGGYILNISGIESKNERLEVNLLLRQPSPDCIVPETLTQPYVMVKTIKSSLVPQFNLSTTTSSCES